MRSRKKVRGGPGLDETERREWDRIEYVEHLVRMAKLNAPRKLRQTALRTLKLKI